MIKGPEIMPFNLVKRSLKKSYKNWPWAGKGA